MGVWVINIGFSKKLSLNKIKAIQSITLRRIINAPFFFSNLTTHQDIGTEPVEIEAALFYKRLFNRIQNHQNLLINDKHTFTLPGNPRRRLKRKWYCDHFN